MCRVTLRLEQLFFDLRPARFEDARQLFDGDAVDAGRTLVAHHCTQCRFYVVWGTNRLHQMLCGCRAFGFGRRRDCFDLLPVQARGFTPAGPRQGQLELVWRSRFGHETPDLLALSFNPLSGTVRAFGRRTGLLCPLLTSAPRSGRLATASVPKDTAQISRSKPDSLHRTPAGFTVLALDGYGLCDILPARPTSAASYPVSVRRVATLLHASFRQSLAVLPPASAGASSCALLTAIRLHRGLAPPKLSDMSDTQAGAARHRAGRGCGLDPTCPMGGLLGMRSARCAGCGAATPGLTISGDRVGGDQDFAHHGGEGDFPG